MNAHIHGSISGTQASETPTVVFFCLSLLTSQTHMHRYANIIYVSAFKPCIRTRYYTTFTLSLVYSAHPNTSPMAMVLVLVPARATRMPTRSTTRRTTAAVMKRGLKTR